MYGIKYNKLLSDTNFSDRYILLSLYLKIWYKVYRPPPYTVLRGCDTLICCLCLTNRQYRKIMLCDSYIIVKATTFITNF